MRNARTSFAQPDRSNLDTAHNDHVDNAQLHDEMEDIASNPSGNRPFHKILAASLSRRGVMQGSLAGAAAGFLTPQAFAREGAPRPGEEGPLCTFSPLTIAEATRDNTRPSISSDYQYQVFIPWGTPIEPGATEAFTGDPNKRPTAKQAALQVGIGHDGMWFFPKGRITRRIGDRASRKGVLCVNHEFGTNSHVLGKSAPESLEEVRISQNVHGVSVLEIENRSGSWEVVRSANARRITVNTPVDFSGPAAGSELLQNSNGNIPLGTVNNCGSGPTPWGTYLTCEENFNGYFGASEVSDEAIAADPRTPLPNPTQAQARYGFSPRGFNYEWWRFDKRFDLSDPDYVNEANRFGWVVEIDPNDGTQKPVKRTALGRFKHEAIAIATSRNGRIAAYMGDDQRFDYCYKYVSDRSWRDALRQGVSPLDEGALFVARFNDDNTGEWLKLSIDNPVLAAQFKDQAELLINTRLAADLLGATPMDRPEWTTIGRDGSVFWTLTNNSRRAEANGPNPQAPNNDGHIIKTIDAGDFLGTRFTWEIFILASSTRGSENAFTDPDAAYADPFGRLFIGTDGGQPDGLQDQLVVFDTTAVTPEPKRLLTGVVNDEITGWTVTPDFRTAFTNIQHPGSGDPARTNFPAPTDGVTIPRDCTLIITRKDRGVIGS